MWTQSDLNPRTKQFVLKTKSFTYKTGKTPVTVSNNNVIIVIIDPNDTQDEPLKTFSSPVTDDFVQFLDLIRFPQRTALEYLLTDER